MPTRRRHAPASSCLHPLAVCARTTPRARARVQSLGEYIPQGMAKRYAKVHEDLKIPMFKPIGVGKINQKARPLARVYALRFQNGRMSKYSRMVLDEKFKQYFSERELGFLTFVDSTSEQLEDNKRNALMAALVDVYAGNSTRLTVDLKNGVVLDPEERQPTEVRWEIDGQVIIEGQKPVEDGGKETAGVNDGHDDSDPLDGAALGGGGEEAFGADGGAMVGGGRPMTRGRGSGATSGATTGTVTKQQAAQQKRAGGVNGGNGGKRRSVQADSSDEEEVIDDEDDAGATGGAVGEVGGESTKPKRKATKQPAPTKPKKKAPKKMTQQKMTFKFSIGPVKLDSDTSKAISELPAPVEPPLDVKNATGRLVFVPASEWPEDAERDGVAGWLGRIKKVENSGANRTGVHFKEVDSNGWSSNRTMWFTLSHVVEHFKPVS